MKRVVKKCLNCASTFLVSPSRDWREHCCSTLCKKEWRSKHAQSAREQRRRSCLECGAIFYPRQYQIDTGNGNYCSAKCQHVAAVYAAHTPEANEKRNVSRRRSIEVGKYVYKKGSEHPRWKGGPVAARRRRTANGKAAICLRAYRAANPHKTREWHQNRRARKVGRLPKGTVASIFSLQRGLCAICSVDLGSGYHTDHIMPLARGGKHEPNNIQLLCPTCNVRKSAKDPIQFMKEVRAA